MIKVAPAILAEAKEELKEQLEKVVNLSNLISFDVAESGFVDGLNTPRPKDFPVLSKGKKIFWHLMVENPIDFIEECLKLETQIIAIHAEAHNPIEALEGIKNLGVQACIVFNPTTNPENFEELIKVADIVQIMTVIPGAQGRDFDDTNLAKINWIRSINPNIQIAIDGGINLKTIEKVKSCKPDYIVVGSFLTKSQNPEKNFKDLMSEGAYG